MDAVILDHAIQAELLERETIQSHRRNPMFYLGPPAGGIDLLMKRTFAPPAERLKSIIGRLKAAPPLIDAMKANMRNPPKEFADLGLIVAKGSVGFFKEDLSTWAKTAAGSDTALLAEFTAANQKVIDAFEAAAKWIETELLPNAKGTYALGAENYIKKLEAE